jgi:hypothetical protein
MPFDEYPDDRSVHYPVALVYSIVIALIWFPAAVTRFLGRLLKEIGTDSWPRAEGTITSGDVRVIHGWLADYALGRLHYCYRIHGEYYSGHLVRQFADEQAAWDFVDSRRNKPVVVRCKDDRPDISVLRASDQLTYSGVEGKSGVGTQVWEHWRDELRGEPRDPEVDLFPGDLDGDDLDQVEEAKLTNLGQGNPK